MKETESDNFISGTTKNHNNYKLHVIMQFEMYSKLQKKLYLIKDYSKYVTIRMNE